ncbi:MAG: glutamate--tRNA ligase [Candidatus Moranbacteria bacterium]|nr:glutamate--tRNA ligase [Candidatus Moranbacteria bacterium]
MDKKVRVRFAPSPTGYLHVGGLRSALYNYLFAKKNGGDFILKIEDTDRKRFVEGAVESLISSLDWVGLNRNEGVFLKEHVLNPENKKIIESASYPGVMEIGEFGPYIQSENLAVYKKYAEELVAAGKAYYCFCEQERLDQVKAERIANKQAPMYDRYCLKNVSAEEVNEKLKSNCAYTIRLKVPADEVIEFEDLIRGKVSINSNTVDDQVLMKSDGFPTYHLANVIDDHMMGTTQVIRGEEWLPSTPKHILLYRAFGWDIPEFAHLPLLLSTDKKKLSKRMGDVAVEDYIKKGYLKEAIINFVVLLGWNIGDGSTQEVFSLAELEQVFDLKRVHKAGAVFDLKKLDWLNAQYIKKLSVDELYEKSLEFFAQKEFYKTWNVERESWSAEEKEIYLKKVLQIEQERLNNLSEVGENNQFFFAPIAYDKTMLNWKDMSPEALRESLQKSIETLSGISEENWELKNIEEKLFATAGDKKGDLLWPLRVALSGAQKSPSPMELAWVLGKTESLQRLQNALEK